MRTRRLWGAAAAVAVVAGLSLSALIANARVADERRNAALEFRAASADVVARIRSEVLHIEDLSQGAQAFVRRAPELTSTELRSWADDVRVFDRYPSVQNLAVVAVVDDAQLAAHIARITEDARLAGAPFEFALDPASSAAAYCLQLATIGEGTPPLDRNLCPGMNEQQAFQLRNIETTQFIPSKTEGFESLAITVPLYESIGIPTTPEERARTFVAYVGLSFVPTRFLDEAVARFPGVEATLEFYSADPSLGEMITAFSTGTVRGEANRADVEVGGGWRVVVTEEKQDITVLSSVSARRMAGAGGLLTVLIAAVLYLLATGRARAIRLVEQKTGELSHQALHDSLTGLANRALLVDRLDQLLARARRNDSVPACLFLDLDGFKNVNDSLGHEAGDILLKAVASRLIGAVREADTIARIGGDEFVLLLDGATLHAAPELVAERLVDVLRQPFDVEGVDTTMRVTASVGVATGLRDDGDSLLRDADFALYSAKDAGKNQVMVFRAEMQDTVRHGVELEFDLRAALEQEQFRLVYQPILNLGDLTVVGYEALLRWEHPSLGRLAPDEFIPTLEKTGQIVEVGRWVLHEACAQLARWHEAGSVASVSVNVSARQFEGRGLVDDVRSALDAAGLPPTSLTVEITESSLMRNIDVCVEQLGTLRAMGVRVAIDDFGTGYSSLASLQQLPVDCLKIDRSFVAAMTDGPESRALIHTIVQLGKDLGLQTLAEGVETAAQAAGLRGGAIDRAQGFLFARPLDAAEVERTMLPAIPTPPAAP
jgi:diguanylate cyclase (GGDEF)-like protein